MKRDIAPFAAPSCLGLGETGVENLPEALEDAGLLDCLGASWHGWMPSMGGTDEIDPDTGLRNATLARDYSLALADKIVKFLDEGKFPLIVGGDCSILIGIALGLSRLGEYGLLFLDGHSDFYQGDTVPDGELSAAELAIITGRGPDVLCAIDGKRSYIADENVVVLGYRDEDESASEGAVSVKSSGMKVYDLETVRKLTAPEAARQSAKYLDELPTEGTWIHLDVDVLDFAEMPAVDFPLAGGLSYNELKQVLREHLKSGKVVGMDVAILNPDLAPSPKVVKDFSMFVCSLLVGAAVDA
jgi:arginase